MYPGTNDQENDAPVNFFSTKKKWNWVKVNICKNCYAVML